MGLIDDAERMPTKLLGGMIKSAAIARAVPLDPPLVFRDEPSAGLDPSISTGLDFLTMSPARHLGTTFVGVVHELDSIMTIADRVTMFDKVAKVIIA